MGRLCGGIVSGGFDGGESGCLNGCVVDGVDVCDGMLVWVVWCSDVSVAVGDDDMCDGFHDVMCSVWWLGW